MNPKDIPFMAFFLFTLWSGFRLADSLEAHSPDISVERSGGRAFPYFTVKESLPFLRSPQLVLAGILLGMTMSIRLLGPLPGLLIVLYLAFRFRQGAIPVIVAYFICAGAAMFITWPYLWSNPIAHWMDSLVLMSSFPWPGRVLFNGEYYDPDHLPISYLPTLLNIQLTEPLLALLYLGLIVLIFASLRKRIKPDLLLVIILGALLPLVALIGLRATMYDNFRQILFLLPPLILLSGVALNWIFSILKPAPFRLFLLLALALPGIHAISRLHPYQYIYYNSLAGGLSGAFRKFEMDYWAISYREAALWLNQNVPANSKIGGGGPAYLLCSYLRPDLNSQEMSKIDTPYDYFVLTSRYNRDLTLNPHATAIYSIEREGAILTAIKQRSP